MQKAMTVYVMQKLCSEISGGQVLSMWFKMVFLLESTLDMVKRVVKLHFYHHNLKIFNLSLKTDRNIMNLFLKTHQFLKKMKVKAVKEENKVVKEKVMVVKVEY